jgi:hypothetical protein
MTGYHPYADILGVEAPQKGRQVLVGVDRLRSTCRFFPMPFEALIALAGLCNCPSMGRTYGVHQHGQMSPSKYSFSVPVPCEMITSAGNHWAWPSRNPMLLPLR